MVKRHRVTSKEVAARAGVSRTTVSFVLNNVRSDKVSEATRGRVLQAARELGYIPDAAARTLVSGKTGTIGLVVSRAEHIGVDAFIPQTLHGLSRVCAQRGYRLLLETSEDDSVTYDYAQLVQSKQIDGLVVLNPDPRDERLDALIETGYPVSLIGSYPNRDAAAVSIDSVTAMDEVTTHLIRLGHTRIGFIHYRTIRDLSTGGRFRGFRAALEREGIALDERLIRSGDYSAQSGYDAMRALLSSGPPPSALVTGNDTIAIGAISAIVDGGLDVPGDIAVVGFDDIPLARFATPALTTVRVPAQDMATACGEQMVKLIEGCPIEHRKQVFPTALIVRDSCGANA
jgi:DNA-binding LacI/PurR family transcriptional regulator